MQKVAPSECFRVELDEALAGVGEDQVPVEMVGWLGARLILQQALEDEVTEFLGCRRCERSEETVSHRNGYEPWTVRTTSGPVGLERPRVRDASRPGFESRILGRHVTRSYALESLVICSFLRGLSVRDVEAVLQGDFRSVGFVALDGVSDPWGHSGALPALGPAAAGGARPGVFVLGRDCAP